MQEFIQKLKLNKKYLFTAAWILIFSLGLVSMLFFGKQQNNHEEIFSSTWPNEKIVENVQTSVLKKKNLSYL